MTRSERGNCGQEAGGRHDEAALALKRFDDDCGDVVGADLLEQSF